MEGAGYPTLAAPTESLWKWAHAPRNPRHPGRFDILGTDSVIIVYPHTSNWDFFVGYLARLAVGLPVRWIGKDTIFRWPVAGLLRRMGGSPVNRRERSGLTANLLREFQGSPWLWLAIAPEGTRSHADRWKSGFYHLALAAGVPVGLAFIDYRERVLGLRVYLDLTGDEEHDLARMRAVYAGKTGRNPDQASNIRFRASTPTAERAPMATDYANIVSAPDRTDADRALDEGRRPAETLAFLGVGPGMRVGELAAGGGYMTELVVRAVGESGVVFAENPPAFLAAFLKKPWEERVARLAGRTFVRCDRAFEEPFPPEAKDLDLVFINVTYHDAVNAKADRARMNGAVLSALKRGGHYVVIDSSARSGTGLGATESLHRIDEAAVKAEVEAAGFKLEASGDFLRHPDDTRDWSSSARAAGRRRGQGDRFALRFVKP